MHRCTPMKAGGRPPWQNQHVRTARAPWDTPCRGRSEGVSKDEGLPAARTPTAPRKVDPDRQCTTYRACLNRPCCPTARGCDKGQETNRRWNLPAAALRERDRRATETSLSVIPPLPSIIGHSATRFKCGPGQVRRDRGGRDRQNGDSAMAPACRLASMQPGRVPGSSRPPRSFNAARCVRRDLPGRGHAVVGPTTRQLQYGPACSPGSAADPFQGATRQGVAHHFASARHHHVGSGPTAALNHVHIWYRHRSARRRAARSP